MLEKEQLKQLYEKHTKNINGRVHAGWTIEDLITDPS